MGNLGRGSKGLVVLVTAVFVISMVLMLYVVSGGGDHTTTEYLSYLVTAMMLLIFAAVVFWGVMNVSRDRREARSEPGEGRTGLHCPYCNAYLGCSEEDRCPDCGRDLKGSR